MYQLYVALGDTFIRRMADNAIIPMDTGNSDYRVYLDWVAEGNTALPADTPA
jgi:hypothetical protein